MLTSDCSDECEVAIIVLIKGPELIRIPVGQPSFPVLSEEPHVLLASIRHVV